jgi:hypothetical protein
MHCSHPGALIEGQGHGTVSGGKPKAHSIPIRRTAMTPLELLNTSILQLRTLVAFLDDQLSDANSAEIETRACKELARSLGVLISAHEALRCEASAGAQPEEGAQQLAVISVDVADNHALLRKRA